MCAQKYIADKSVHKNMYQTKVCTKICIRQKCGQKSIEDKSVHKLKMMTDKRDDGFQFISVFNDNIYMTKLETLLIMMIMKMMTSAHNAHKKTRFHSH